MGTAKKLNIYQRIHAVMGDVQYVEKDGKAPVGYKFASHDHVTDTCRPALLKNGIVVESSIVSHEIHEGEDRQGNHVWLSVVHLKMDFVNIDEPADRTSGVFIGYGLDGQDKGIGKATSYASKYGLLKTFQLPTGDDPERESINFTPKSEPAQTEPTKKDLWLELKSRYEHAPGHAITAAACAHAMIADPKKITAEELTACINEPTFAKAVSWETDKLDSGEGTSSGANTSEAGASGNGSSPHDREVSSEAGVPGGGPPPEGADEEATLTPRQRVIALCEKDGVGMEHVKEWACERLKMDKLVGSAAYNVVVDEWADVVAAVEVAA